LAETRINTLAAELNAQLQQVPATEFNANDGRYSTAEGANFNYQLAVNYPGSAVHNPFLVEALLLATIAQVEDDYGVSAAPTLSMTPLFGQQSAGATR